MSARESFWSEVLSKRSRNVLVTELDAGGASAGGARADGADAGSVPGVPALTGWITFGRSRDDDASPGTAELYGLYVDPDRWRSGTGIALWRAMLDRVGREGWDVVTLWVFRENVRARAFYEAVGFRVEPDVTKSVERGGARPMEIRYRRLL